MDVGDRDEAAAFLRRISYYRLSGYWYPFRQQVHGHRIDNFYPGTRLDDVVALYEFDARLRAATFSVLVPVELAIRALLGHELGRIDPCAHLDEAKLGPTARSGGSLPSGARAPSGSLHGPARTSSGTITTSTGANSRCGRLLNYWTGEA